MADHYGRDIPKLILGSFDPYKVPYCFPLFYVVAVWSKLQKSEADLPFVPCFSGQTKGEVEWSFPLLLYVPHGTRQPFLLTVTRMSAKRGGIICKIDS